MKHRASKQNSLESQVKYVIDFMRTHEWISPHLSPLNQNLDYYTEKYLYDSFTALNNACHNHIQGDYDEAKKWLGYSLIWKDEAIDCSFLSGSNNFTTLLFKKTDEIFNNTIQEICSVEFSQEKISFTGLEGIKSNLKEIIEPHSV